MGHQEEPSLWAVVPAGGAGTRLWPLSRAASPKFLHDLTGSGRSLLQQTLDRLQPLVGDRVLVVTGRTHADAVRRQLPGLPADRVLAEPSPRDSMAAIGLAAALVERTDPDALIGSFAADHVITDPERFRACVREAAAVAAQGHLVTLGITPTHPATGFGYIHTGTPLPGFPTACRVEAFVEKPDLDRARAWVASGEYRWNAGMFVARAGTLLDLLAERHADMARSLRAIAADPDVLDECWPGLTRIAIDHAVAEPAAAAGRVAVVPADFGWADLGDFAALHEQLGGEAASLSTLGDALVVGEGSSGLVVAGDRPIVVLGVQDAVVVDMGDVVLVTDLAHAQDVKGLVARMQELGRADLT
ncbi:MAG TPA: mannose-1-phosphate guanylyltransferase [Marmoricola sp.]|jgi:mannose-1-phosphate guanylyltransferase|nr:mannose-1-phosphate guanylyltransferase [Marmoricola sp.]